MQRSASGTGSWRGSSSRHSTGQRVHGGVGAEGGALLTQLGFVLAEVVFQLLQLAGLGQAGDDVKVLAEIVAQMARLLHIGPKLGVAAGLHSQKLVFPVQLGAAGVLPGHLIHLIQQQEDAQQRDRDGQHGDDHQPVDEDDARVQRHTEHKEGRVDGGQRPRRLPEGFAPVLPQQPAAPLDRGEPEEDAEHRRQPQLEQGSGDKADRRVVVHLGPGIEHDGEQIADGDHDGREGEEKGRLPGRDRRLHPPEQQPECRQEDGQEHHIAVQLKDSAESRRRKVDDGNEEGGQQGSAAGRFQMLPQRGEAEERPRVEDGEVQKIASE